MSLDEEVIRTALAAIRRGEDGTLLSDRRYGAVYACSQSLVAKAYKQRDESCPHPDPSLLANAEWEWVIGAYLHAEGVRAPRPHGIIVVDTPAHPFCAGPQLLLIMDRVHYRPYDSLGGSDRKHAERQHRRLLARARRLALLPVDSYISNNALYEERTGNLHLIDFSRWEVADGDEGFARLYERYPPIFYDEHGTRLSAKAVAAMRRGAPIRA